MNEDKELKRTLSEVSFELRNWPDHQESGTQIFIYNLEGLKGEVEDFPW